jgi:hypothetical protein
MSISGHRTEATYRRYNISTVKRKRNGLVLMQEFRDAEAARAASEQANVIPIAAQK